jgi:SWIM/SEC-C metal-binding protein
MIGTEWFAKPCRSGWKSRRMRVIMAINIKGAKMKIYDGKKEARLGTKRNPAVVTVQTEERGKEIAAIFEEKGWEYKIQIKPDKPEDIIALGILQNTPKPRVVENKIGRNAPCPCGSGQKYKKCCGR